MKRLMSRTIEPSRLDRPWDEEPELVDALAGVIAQQSQLAGGYLVSPDACAPGGAVVAGDGPLTKP